LIPGSEIRIRDQEWKKIQIQDPGSGMNIPDLIFEYRVSVIWVLWVLKFFESDTDPGSGILSNLDPGSGIRDGKNRNLDPGWTS
jgi:hypothetical protein